MLFLAADIVLYSILYWYVDNVRQGEFGVAQVCMIGWVAAFICGFV
jgi:hypothetical protein